MSEKYFDVDKFWRDNYGEVTDVTFNKREFNIRQRKLNKFRKRWSRDYKSKEYLGYTISQDNHEKEPTKSDIKKIEKYINKLDNDEEDI